MTRNKTVLLCSPLLFLGRATSQEIQDEWEHNTNFPQNQRRNQNLGNFKKHTKEAIKSYIIWDDNDMDSLYDEESKICFVEYHE